MATTEMVGMTSSLFLMSQPTIIKHKPNFVSSSTSYKDALHNLKKTSTLSIIGRKQAINLNSPTHNNPLQLLTIRAILQHSTQTHPSTSDKAYMTIGSKYLELCKWKCPILAP